ncbi:hypothetical protein CBR_g16923 [Chara braunii]|uniref:Uncharacterized protein n=1 Tax=Chara braunii TaxID=69332 RepID=A0A388KU51_CHABU|nr:hypothetical protein CBR_g16923 [Chara braunii]|eukprot:GBG73581.1 hypothetical protein CBR_g16923 [Chara braunii]
MENIELSDVKKLLEVLVQQIAGQKDKQPMVEPMVEEAEDSEDVDLAHNVQNADEEKEDEGGFVAYMKVRQEYYASLHYTKVEELCKAKAIHYFRKDMDVWELAKLDLQEYADHLAEGASYKIGEPSRRNYSWDEHSDLGSTGCPGGDGSLAGN